MRNWINLLESQGELFPDYDKKHREERYSKWRGEYRHAPIVYHATAKDFDSFKTSGSGMISVLGMDFDTERHGAFFAEDPDFALEFVMTNGRVRDGARIIPVHLAINYPFDLRDNYIRGDNEIIEEMKELGIDYRDILRTDQYMRWQCFDGPEGKDFVNALETLGYDGAVMVEKTDHADSGVVWVAFHPNQIKSATANRGSFSPDSEKITEDYGYELNVITNPSKSEYLNVVRLSHAFEEPPVRAALQISSGDLYIWDSISATHGAVMDRLELGPIVHLFIQDNTVTVLTLWRYERLGYDLESITEMVKSNKNIRRIMRSGFEIIVNP